MNRLKSDRSLRLKAVLDRCLAARDKPLQSLSEYSSLPAEPPEVRKRPPLFRALGAAEPPDIVTVAAIDYHRLDTLKHDSWAATALYADPAGNRIIGKFNRAQPAFGIPLAWLGRWLARRESRFIQRLADVELVPNDLGPVTTGGSALPNAVARSYVAGDVYRHGAPVDDAFFDTLSHLLAEVHDRAIAYVDLNKPENIVVDQRGRPVLIDFQISFGLSERWPGNGRSARFVLTKLQDMDNYHLRKHLARHQKARGEDVDVKALEKPALVRWHRRVFGPIRQLRRRLLTHLKVRDASGQAGSELEPEDALRKRPDS